MKERSEKAPYSAVVCPHESRRSHPLSMLPVLSEPLDCVVAGPGVGSDKAIERGVADAEVGVVGDDAASGKEVKSRVRRHSSRSKPGTGGPVSLIC